MVTESKSNIKVKVVAGYILVFLAIIASVFIAYQSYNKLLDSVLFLSKPDAEIARMNRILTNLSEAENKIRIYSLTKKERYLANYAENIIDIQIDLDSLRNFSADSKSFLLIDSMSFLLEERADNLEKFVALKRSKEKENLSQKAIDQLSEVSGAAKTKIKTTTTTTTFLDTVVSPSEVKAEKRKGFVARLFSGKKVETKIDSIETVIKRTQIKIDTSYLPQSDSLLRSLENMLLIAQAKERLNREIVSNEELRLVEENSLMWDKIKVLLHQLEGERLRQLTHESESAKKIANHSIFVISVIIIVGFILGILFIIFILTDITKSNFYRKELFVAKGKAEKLAKVKEDFLATMSHEIRTPLNAIIGFTNQLTKTHLEDQQQAFVRVLKNSSTHLLGIVNEILDLSKIEAGKLHIEKIPFHPYSLVFDVYDILKINAENKEVDFTWEYEGNKQVNLESDPFRIKQILLNLGSNALKFTTKGSVHLKVSVTQQEKLFLFEVQVVDTGIGIEEDKLEAIFDNFSQADSFSARKYGGTGLGLAISRRLSRLLGGDLKVESKFGEGSCFSLKIPLIESQEKVTASEATKNTEVADYLLQKSFLVADDDPYSLLLLKSIFLNWGLKADFVENGAKAFELVNQQEYDLILTDIHMPDMGGIELCRRIRELENSKKSEVPIIALTANVRESDLQEYIASGMTDCLVKPFDERQLIRMLHNLFDFDDHEDIGEESSLDIVESEQLFDLSQIRQFSADDEELLNQILAQFIESAHENIDLMHKALLDENYLRIGEIAHKMLSSFNQLKVKKVLPILLQLEAILHKNEDAEIPYEKVREWVDELIVNTKKVTSSIQNEILS